MRNGTGNGESLWFILILPLDDDVSSYGLAGGRGVVNSPREALGKAQEK